MCVYVYVCVSLKMFNVICPIKSIKLTALLLPGSYFYPFRNMGTSYVLFESSCFFIFYKDISKITFLLEKYLVIHM